MKFDFITIEHIEWYEQLLNQVRDAKSKMSGITLYVTLFVAAKLVNKLHITAAENNLWWSSPLINISNLGEGEFEEEVVLEWWNKGRKYTVYVDYEKNINYIAVWGADMDNEMEEGDINIENDLTEFWEWIAE